MKAMLAGCVMGLVVVCAAGAGPVSGTASLNVFADADHSIRRVEGTPWYSAEAWVWCYPDAKGMMAAEFRLTFTNAYPHTVTMNSDITVAMGSLPNGISVAFGSCQQGWTWIAHQTFWVGNSGYGEVLIAPHPTEGLQIASCEPGFPIYPAYSLNDRVLINCQATQVLFKPRLTDVEIIASDAVLATFDNNLINEACWWPKTSNFRVLSATYPPETLDVTDAWFWDEDDYRTVRVRLGQNLVPGVDYILEATNMCNDEYVGSCCCCMCQCMNCADSEMGFAYAPIATLLRDFSVERLSGGIQVSWVLGAADKGITFEPMRLASGGAGFEPLAAAVVEEGSLQYRLIDSDAQSRSSCKYRIDYVDDGVRSTLFETDWVEALPAKFALHQNLPNPFNPSTRISFELGGPCRATLAVYDVSGKLVRVLIDETLAAGAHSAIWNGRTGRGEKAASGIYFYKLRAGSFTETRKMVLLR